MSQLVRWVESDDEGHPCWDLMVGRRKRCAARVWKNGTWHTFNRYGHGGENDAEDTVREAKRQAADSAIMQGFV